MVIRTFRWLLTAVLTLAAVLTICCRGDLRQAYETTLILSDVISGETPGPFDLRPVPERSTLNFSVDERNYLGDLYRTPDRVMAGALFVPGAAPEGKDDPRVVTLSRSLARSRIAVLVPDIVELRELKLLPETSTKIADGLVYLKSRRDLTPGGRLGLITTSVAIGPGVRALVEPPLAVQVDFVVSIGGYHDLPRTLTYLTTGYYERRSGSPRTKPPPYGRWVYALSNASRIEDPENRAIFSEIARRMLREQSPDTDDLAARLSPEARAAYEFIINTDPGRSRILIQQLPRQLRTDIAALDIRARDLSQLRTCFILVHGKDDPLIPSGESVSLFDALPPGRAQLFLLDNLTHVDTSARLADGPRMWQAIWALLDQRRLGRGGDGSCTNRNPRP